MLELAHTDQDHPYTGGETAFYDYVRKVRRARKQTPRELALRFEGMPGEFLQIDWGEVRDLPFSKEGLGGQTRYFFAARLKYSRYMFVRFERDMREETLMAGKQGHREEASDMCSLADIYPDVEHFLSQRGKTSWLSRR